MAPRDKFLQLSGVLALAVLLAPSSAIASPVFVVTGVVSHTLESFDAIVIAALGDTHLRLSDRHDGLVVRISVPAHGLASTRLTGVPGDVSEPLSKSLSKPVSKSGSKLVSGSVSELKGASGPLLLLGIGITGWIAHRLRRPRSDWLRY